MPTRCWSSVCSLLIAMMLSGQVYAQPALELLKALARVPVIRKTFLEEAKKSPQLLGAIEKAGLTYSDLAYNPILTERVFGNYESAEIIQSSFLSSVVKRKPDVLKEAAIAKAFAEPNQAYQVYLKKSHSPVSQASETFTLAKPNLDAALWPYATKAIGQLRSDTPRLFDKVASIFPENLTVKNRDGTELEVVVQRYQFIENLDRAFNAISSLAMGVLSSGDQDKSSR